MKTSFLPCNVCLKIMLYEYLLSGRGDLPKRFFGIFFNYFYTNPINTRRYLDVDSTFFEHRGSQMNVKSTFMCLPGSIIYTMALSKIYLHKYTVSIFYSFSLISIKLKLWSSVYNQNQDRKNCVIFYLPGILKAISL